MLQVIIKVVLTSLVVVAISEIAKRNSLFAAALASLPLTSILAIIWLYLETSDTEKIAQLATGIFWLVLPSLILFIALPLLLRAGMSFTPSLAISCVLTIAGYAGMLAILNQLNIRI